ncbi:MAG: hypothetical protein ACOYOK_04540 [Pseudobdellovibrionaceae bacterium]
MCKTNRRHRHFLVLCALFVFGSGIFFKPAQAAPVPGFGSSLLADKSLLLYFQPLRLQLQVAPEVWELQSTDSADVEGPAGDSFVQRWTYKNPAAVPAASKKPTAPLQMSLHLFTVKKEATLDTVIKKWMKDYAHFGFEVLESKPYKSSQQKGLLVDFIQRSKESQQRQLIFKKQDRLVILTCTAPSNVFLQVVQKCNESLKTFRFLE